MNQQSNFAESLKTVKISKSVVKIADKYPHGFDNRPEEIAEAENRAGYQVTCRNNIKNKNLSYRLDLSSIVERNGGEKSNRNVLPSDMRSQPFNSSRYAKSDYSRFPPISLKSSREKAMLQESNANAYFYDENSEQIPIDEHRKIVLDELYKLRKNLISKFSDDVAERGNLVRTRWKEVKNDSDSLSNQIQDVQTKFTELLDFFREIDDYKLDIEAAFKVNDSLSTEMYVEQTSHEHKKRQVEIEYEELKSTLKHSLHNNLDEELEDDEFQNTNEQENKEQPSMSDRRNKKTTAREKLLNEAKLLLENPDLLLPTTKIEWARADAEIQAVIKGNDLLTEVARKEVLETRTNVNALESEIKCELEKINSLEELYDSNTAEIAVKSTQLKQIKKEIDKHASRHQLELARCNQLRETMRKLHPEKDRKFLQQFSKLEKEWETCTKLEFLLHSDLKCPYCHKLMENPVTVAPCGHSFCRDCQKIFLNDSGRCCSTCSLKQQQDITAFIFANNILASHIHVLQWGDNPISLLKSSIESISCNVRNRISKIKRLYEIKVLEESNYLEEELE